MQNQSTQIRDIFFYLYHFYFRHGGDKFGGVPFAIINKYFSNRINYYGGVDWLSAGRFNCGHADLLLVTAK